MAECLAEIVGAQERGILSFGLNLTVSFPPLHLRSDQKCTFAHPLSPMMLSDSLEARPTDVLLIPLGILVPLIHPSIHLANISATHTVRLTLLIIEQAS